MIRYALRRIIFAVPVFFIIITAVFFMVRFVPGGPFDRERQLSPETLAALNAYYGLDDSLPVQYVKFLKTLSRGDLGPSYKYQNRSVTELVREKAKVSLELGGAALAIALTVGLACGAVSAMGRGRLSGALDAVSLAGICLPAFVVGPVLIWIFSLKLGWFNAMGWREARDIVLPSVTLALFYAAWIAKLFKDSEARELAKDYSRTAIAKGESPLRVAAEASRAALSPVVSYLAPAAAGMLTGSFVVESIFNIPGLGKFFISSALDSDYTMIMGCVMVYAIFIICFNILADIALALLNPRVAKELGVRK